MTATAQSFYDQITCGCLLRYSLFKSWLNALGLDSTVKSALLSAVLQTGTLSYNNWIILLNAAIYVEHDAAYFINKISTCGYLCMEDIIPAIYYTGDPLPVSREFSDEFAPEFN